MYWMSAIQVASLALLAQLLTPSFDYVSNPALDSSLCIAAAPRLRLLQLLLHRSTSTAVPRCVRFNCCSPIAPASAAARHLCPLQLLLPDCVRFNCSPDCVRFGCCSPIASLQLLLPDCIRFSCCSLLTSASAAAPRLRLLQLLLSDCVCFSCCSPIVSGSNAAS